MVDEYEKGRYGWTYIHTYTELYAYACFGMDKHTYIHTQRCMHTNTCVRACFTCSAVSPRAPRSSPSAASTCHYKKKENQRVYTLTIREDRPTKAKAKARPSTINQPHQLLFHPLKNQTPPSVGRSVPFFHSHVSVNAHTTHPHPPTHTHSPTHPPTHNTHRRLPVRPRVDEQVAHRPLHLRLRVELPHQRRLRGAVNGVLLSF